jgi:hypothetical protein
MVLKAKRLDPPLLPQSERNEEPEFDQLGDCEVLVELFPEGVVGDLRIPDDGARVVSAAFSRGLNFSDSVKFSSSSYFSSVSPFRPAWTERWTPQYSQSMDLET